MIRLLAAALPAVLLAGPALAQSTKEGAAKADELDPKTRALVQAEIAKVKEEIRSEVRAEMQGAQAAAEFLGAVGEGPKLEFLELDGYLRVRGDVLDDFSLAYGLDDAGYALFPGPIGGEGRPGTLSTGNMRLRIEPTLNVSEYARVRTQIDVLDNYVLGSSTGPLYDYPGSPYAVPFYATTRVLSPGDPTADREAILVKRAWAEVQTPIGLLSFGRMPSHWGLGILANSGDGLDQDLGDTVDRVQFAIAPVSTPLGRLAFVPMLDFDAEGVLQGDRRNGAGSGQPFDLSNSDDARTVAIKIARIDTEDEMRRKLERNGTSLNFGVYYAYRTQVRWSPGWYAPVGVEDPADPANWVRQRAYVNYLDLWARFRWSRLTVEMEAAGVYGNVGNASLDAGVAKPELDLRQWGGVVRGEWEAMPRKLTVGGEFGIASGDDAPGFGNRPDRMVAVGDPPVYWLPPYGSLEGPQWDGSDTTISNFRFNPAYRVDLILWREIIGGVTDAFYVRPHLQWTIVPGLVFDAALVYSQALHAESTPSAESFAPTSPDERGTFIKGSTPLGLEGDATLRFATGSGFTAWISYGMLLPLEGIAGGRDLSRASTLRTGLAVRF
ncbi:MAG TPA: TIGR04551 family protein [Anaeromyxobacteraceae bacterium]|nr:TIGR04551 family protein [Anaeromyxobacteraceae bacterium]